MYHTEVKGEENEVDLARKYHFSEKDAKLLGDFLKYLEHKEDFLRYIEKGHVKNRVIPISVFKNKSLAPLETIVKYLREEMDYSYNEIAFLLNRKQGPIGVTYRIAKKKLSSKLDITSTENSIPLSIFKDSKLSIFETIVLYLKDDSKLKFKVIAKLLNRNYRTIWTVYRRAKNK